MSISAKLRHKAQSLQKTVKDIVAEGRPNLRTAVFVIVLGAAYFGITRGVVSAIAATAKEDVAPQAVTPVAKPAASVTAPFNQAVSVTIEADQNVFTAAPQKKMTP